MDKFNLFSDKQFGFMGTRSTSLQLLKVLNKWTSVLDEGGVLNAVYMDCIKAFDKVPHTRLLVKMKAYGLSDKMCIWVQDFLSDRKQCVQVNGMKSQWHKVTSGIPQGSVLGPVLFVIYINDLPECVKSDVFLFADDMTIFREIKDDSDASIIQSDLIELFKWSETWLLKFHPDKCKVCQCSVKISSV
jgi:hypothetical protein